VVGPYSALDIFERIRTRESNWTDFVWGIGTDIKWRRICEIAVFQEFMPPQPSNEILAKIREIATSAQKRRESEITADIQVREEKDGEEEPTPEELTNSQLKVEKAKKWIWFVQFEEGSPFGPFSLEEIRRMISSGKVKGYVYVWCEGMKNWAGIDEIPEFSEIAKDVHRPKRREYPRVPLVAKILLSHNNEVVSVLCQDISEGGLQVLTNQIPGPVGTRTKMNITPDSKILKPFETEGVVERIIDEDRGFAFRFDPLPKNVKDNIIAYVDSTDSDSKKS